MTKDKGQWIASVLQRLGLDEIDLPLICRPNPVASKAVAGPFFEVGVLVSGGSELAPEEHVQIRITEVLGLQVKAEVVACGRSWGAPHRPGGFVLGETLTIAGKGVGGGWDGVVIKPAERPWFVLTSRDEKRSFAHYR